MLIPPAELVGAAKATIRECSVLDVQKCLTADTLVIDIREANELRKGFLRGAVHVPRGLLEFEIHGMIESFCMGDDIALEEQAIVLYCGTGGRSALAALSLQNLGYENVISMAGGITAWSAAQLPLEHPHNA